MPETLRSPKGRVSYPHVFTPKQYKTGKPKYELNLLFDKKEPGLKQMAAAAEAAAREKWPNKKPAAIKEMVKKIFTDGDAKEYNGYEGKYAVRFASTQPPGLIGPDKNEIFEGSDDFYPGCFAHVTYHAYAWDAVEEGTVVNSGVSMTLHNIQKLGDGERLDSRTTADDDFDAVETADTVSSFAGDDDIDF